jgi:hypothetical protein
MRFGSRTCSVVFWAAIVVVILCRLHADRRVDRRLRSLEAGLRAAEASARSDGHRLAGLGRAVAAEDLALAGEIADLAGSVRRTSDRIEARLLAVEAAQAVQARQLGRLARAEERLAVLERPRPAPPERPSPTPPKAQPAAGPSWEWRRIGTVDCWGYQDGPIFRYSACRPVVPSLPNACSR